MSLTLIQNEMAEVISSDIVRKGRAKLLELTKMNSNKLIASYSRYILENQLFKKKPEYNLLGSYSASSISKACNDNELKEGSKTKRGVQKLIEALVHEYTGYILEDGDYVEIDDALEVPKIPEPTFDPINLTNYGLLSITEEEPMDEIKAQIETLGKIQILQSSIANWVKWEGILMQAVTKGVNKIELLLALPYSDAIELRGKSLDKQHLSFSNRAMNIIEDILAFVQRYDPERKIFEIRLYEAPCIITIYQLTDRSDQISGSYFGIFWHGHPSVRKPHFKLLPDQRFASLIGEQFESIWSRYEPISLSLTEFRKYRLQLEGKNERRNFTNKIQFPPNVAYYKAFYWRKNKLESFQLCLDTINMQASIRYTRSNIGFEGIIKKAESNYNLLMSSINLDYPLRILRIQFPKIAIPIDKIDDVKCLYSNADPQTGIPYSKLMYLKKLRSDSKGEFKKCLLLDRSIIKQLRNSIIELI